MSSTQDVRYSAERSSRARTWRTRCGTRRDWCCSMQHQSSESRQEQAPAGVQAGRPPRSRTGGSSRGFSARSRRRRRASTPTTSPTLRSTSTTIFWSELCDWYLEIVKPRLYEGEPDAAANAALGAGADARAGAPDDAVRHRGDLLVPARRAGDGAAEMMVVHPYPEVDPRRWSTRRPSAEVEGWIELDAEGPAMARPGRGRRREACFPRQRGGRATTRRTSSSARLARLSFDGAEGETAGELRSGRDPGVRATSTPTRSAGGSRSAARPCAAEIGRAEGRLGERRVRRQGARPTSSRPSARSSPAIGPSWRSWAAARPRRQSAEGRGQPERRWLELRRGRGVPRLARAPRVAVRPRPDPAARLRARHAPAPVRVDPRRRHERQVVGGRDDRRAARGARQARGGRLPLAAHRPLVGAGAGRAARRSTGDEFGGRGGARRPSRWRWSTGRSTRGSR